MFRISEVIKYKQGGVKAGIASSRLKRRSKLLLVLSSDGLRAASRDDCSGLIGKANKDNIIKSGAYRHPA